MDQQQQGHAAPVRRAPATMAFALRQRANEQATIYYAAALCGLLAIFVIGHFARLLANKRRIPSSLRKGLSPLAAISRHARCALVRKLPGFTSAGHALLVTVFVAINVVLSFTGCDLSSMSAIAARFGWMAAANFTFVVFLALKNTPLAILTSYSYERLNPLHQIAGYTTIAYMIVHAIMYSVYFMQRGKWSILQEDFVTAGIVLGFVMLASGIEAVVLRRLRYELFYVFHIVLFTAMLVTLGLHRPELSTEKIGIISCVAAAMWGLDRLIRFCRLLYNGVGNTATIHPLPNGGTQILLRRPLPFAVPGMHCFVWLPKVRLFETHPFTIVATSPTELIVNTYSGFTRDLHKLAKKNPGISIRVSLEGPYGTFPDPMAFDKVVLVAGGSGASFTFGLASNMLQRMTQESHKQIEFIWAVKDRDFLSWFSDHLNAIRLHTHAPRVALRIHTTRSEAQSPTMVEKSSIPSLRRSAEFRSSTDLVPMSSISETEKDGQLVFPEDLRNVLPVVQNPGKDDISAVVCRMGPRTLTTGSVDVPVQQGRPDVAALLQDAVKSTGKDKRVLVAACGPNGLMKLVRNSAADLITRDGPSVELHCEQFGW